MICLQIVILTLFYCIYAAILYYRIGIYAYVRTLLYIIYYMKNKLLKYVKMFCRLK